MTLLVALVFVGSLFLLVMPVDRAKKWTSRPLFRALLLAANVYWAWMTVRMGMTLATVSGTWFLPTAIAAVVVGFAIYLRSLPDAPAV